MAQLRAASLVQDGTVLRLLDPEDTEHTLPITEELLAELEDARPAEAGSAEEQKRADGPSAPVEGVAQPATAPGPSTTADDRARREDGEQRAAGAAPESASAGARTESASPAPAEPATPLSPRQIQARIRAGHSAQRVAEETGTSLERVKTFEYPVLAERGWIAQQARETQIWVGGPDLYSDIVEDGGPSTLGELVEHRLTELGLAPGLAQWDAWREPHGAWTVAARFPVPPSEALPTDQEPPATWTYRAATRSVDPADDWARFLSAAHAWDLTTQEESDDQQAAQALSPEPRQDADTADRDGEVPPTRQDSGTRDGELLDVLRARRGQRADSARTGDEALARLISHRSADPAAAAEAEAEAEAEEDHPARKADRSALSAVPDLEHEASSDEAEQDEAAHQQPERSAGPSRRARPAMPAAAPARAERPRSGSKRPSVPSWDEIVFGRRGD